MILVGVDPGKVTGVAIWWDSTEFDGTNHLDIDTCEVTDASQVPTVIRRMLDGQRPTLILCERFNSAGGKALTSQPDAQQIVGMMRSLAEELQCRCVYQSPGPAKKIMPNSRLKKIGWYTSTKDGHANDAARHVGLGLASFYPATFARLVDL